MKILKKLPYLFFLCITVPVSVFSENVLVYPSMVPQNPISYHEELDSIIQYFTSFTPKNDEGDKKKLQKLSNTIRILQLVSEKNAASIQNYDDYLRKLVTLSEMVQNAQTLLGQVSSSNQNSSKNNYDDYIKKAQLLAINLADNVAIVVGKSLAKR